MENEDLKKRTKNTMQQRAKSPCRVPKKEALEIVKSSKFSNKNILKLSKAKL
jgi:hypothetical protein